MAQGYKTGGRQKGTRNRKTMIELLSAFQADKPMRAEELLTQLRSNRLWFKAVEFALAQEDSRALITILTYLHDKAYGSAPKSVQITHDIVHHDASALERARVIAREILNTIDADPKDMAERTLTE